MKYVGRAVPIFVALVVFLSFMWAMQDRPVQGAVGVVSINGGTASTTAVSYATIGGTIAIRVVDADLIADTQTVAIKSSSDSTGFTVTLAKLQAGQDTDSYIGTVLMATTTLATTTVNAGRLKVADNDRVTVTYTDDSEDFGTADTITIETGDPDITNLGPTNFTITKATTLVLTADLTDTVSRADRDSIRFLFGTDIDLDFATEVVPLTFTAIQEGTTVIGLHGLANARGPDRWGQVHRRQGHRQGRKQADLRCRRRRRRQPGQQGYHRHRGPGPRHHQNRVVLGRHQQDPQGQQAHQHRGEVHRPP